MGGVDGKDVELLARNGGFELVETHISWVLLGTDSVYKIKKPVKFSFLDFSTLARRKKFCGEEVRLNSRLAPDVYLGVVPLVRAADGAISFGAGGRAVAYAVRMRRLDQTRMMDRLLAAKKVSEEDVRRLAGIIAGFHLGAEVMRPGAGGRQCPGYGSPKLVWKHIAALGDWRSAIQEACGLGADVDFLLERSQSFITRNTELLEGRIAAGMVRDCHGDLHAANVFLQDGILIVDCIEFSPEYRCVDVASDLAFMAMDLDAFGEERLSAILVDEYLSKTRDPELRTLFPLYKCYRANVRAKIAAIEWTQRPDAGSVARIKKYIALAKRYAGAL